MRPAKCHERVEDFGEVFGFGALEALGEFGGGDGGGGSLQGEFRGLGFPGGELLCLEHEAGAAVEINPPVGGRLGTDGDFDGELEGVISGVIIAGAGDTEEIRQFG